MLAVVCCTASDTFALQSVARRRDNAPATTYLSCHPIDLDGKSIYFHKWHINVHSGNPGYSVTIIHSQILSPDCECSPKQGITLVLGHTRISV